MCSTRLLAILSGLVLLTLALDTPSTRDEGHRRQRRTMGAGGSFINCLAIGESSQRICSHDVELLQAIERQQKGGNYSCADGKVFHLRCNVCKCLRNGAFECTTDLCGEDFFNASGLPRYW